MVDDEGSLVEMWSFDLTKAFDLLDHEKALRLCHSFSITGWIGQCIQNWLTDRTQYVECGNKKSSKIPVGKSCVQGSVLGPTLWLIYIQSLMNKLKDKCEFYAYADDIAIIKRIANQDNQDQFNSVIQILQEWAGDYEMRWSSAKTQGMVFK